jgi:hypothetical protein
VNVTRRQTLLNPNVLVPETRIDLVEHRLASRFFHRSNSMVHTKLLKGELSRNQGLWSHRQVQVFREPSYAVASFDQGDHKQLDRAPR